MINLHVIWIFEGCFLKKIHVIVLAIATNGVIDLDMQKSNHVKLKGLNQNFNIIERLSPWLDYLTSGNSQDKVVCIVRMDVIIVILKNSI